MKKCIVLLFALVLVLLAIPALEGEVRAEIAYGETFYYEYSISNGEATITKVPSASGAITIPSSLDGYPVTSIGTKAFYGCFRLTKVTIADSVTSIGSYAFADCTNLTAVVIPDSVTKISGAAFLDCTSLVGITLSNSITYIGSRMFYNCDSLTGITIPDSVIEIESDAFYNCDSLTGITIPDSVTEIGSFAFYDCDGLTGITIPDSVKVLGEHAFSKCDRLTSVYLGKGLTDYTFGFCNCPNLKTVYIPRIFNWFPKSLFSGTVLEDIWYAGSKMPQFSGDTTAIKNATWHFNYCGKDNHTYDNVCDTTCNICGFTREVPDHVYDLVCDPDCNICGARRYVSHTYSNSCDTVCNVCSRERDISHTYTNNCDTTCNICKYVREIQHTYSASCDATCNVCDFSRIATAQHTYTNTCDTTCNYCGFTRTITHTYDNADDLTCNVCKESLPPPSPKLKSRTHNTITLVAVEGMEYRVDYGSWQSSPVFAGLEAEAQYRFEQRVAASAVAKVSEPSRALYEYTSSPPPVVTSKTDTSITVKVSNSSNVVSLDGVNWFNAKNSQYTFQNLTPGTTYTVYQRNGYSPDGMVEVTTYRHMGTVSYYANGGSGAPASQTKVEETELTLSAQKPTRTGYVFMGWATTDYGDVAYQPSDKYTKENSVTLYAVWTVSCSTCGGDGDIGTACDNCNGRGSISYTYAGCPSCGSTSITYYVTGSVSYYYVCRSCIHTFYSPSNVTVSTDCQQCYGSGSNRKTCTNCNAEGWVKGTHKTAPAPTLVSKDYVSVTLKKVDGMEYSLDGTTWQSSNVFTRLDPGTKHHFYQRYQATQAHNAAKAGAALTVTTGAIPADGFTLKKVGGVWKYYVGNTFVPITTVASFSGSRYYVEDGVVPSSYTGWKDYKGQKLYIKSGKPASNGLHKVDGSWYYIKNGALASDVTSLVKYNGEWFYVKNGKVASDTTTLVKLNGEWFYVVKGKMAGNTTGLVKWSGEWWYVVKGKIAGKTTTLIKYNNEWFYVVKGKMAGNTTTLLKYNGGWYYIVKGKLAAKTTTLVTYGGKRYYVASGKVNFSKTGLIQYSGNWYYIEKGLVSSKTLFVSNSGMQYYVKAGVVQLGVSGGVSLNGKTYYIRKGVLTDCHTAGHTYQAATCTSSRICSKCTHTSGTALGHYYAAATCTKPATCIRCGMTNGHALGHNRLYRDQYCDRCGSVGAYYFNAPQVPLQLDVNGVQKCRITEVSFYQNDYAVYIEVSGTCTETDYHNQPMRISYKLYDSNQVVVYSGELWTPLLDTGDRFTFDRMLIDRDKLISGETYSLVLIGAVS